MQIKGRIRNIKVHDKTVTLHIQIRGEDFTPDSIKGFQELGGRTHLLTFEPLHDRHVTATRQQINSIYALINGYCLKINETQDYCKQEFKDLYLRMTGHEIVSFGRIDRLTASDLIEKMFHLALRDKWLPYPPYQAPVIRNELVLGCYVNRVCAICGEHGEEHHIEAIGAGSDRTTYDDSQHHVIILCRGHHREAHEKGWPVFEVKYNLQDITIKKWEILRQLEVRGWENGQNLFLDEW